MNIEALPRAFGAPPASGRFPVAPADFHVDEILGFEPDGDGQHVLIQVRKQGSNTEWVARRLAQVAGVRVGDVGYAGLKDRHAVTSQWFSVDLAGRPEPDWTCIETSGLSVLRAVRHRRKLRRGVLSGNRFSLRIHDVVGDTAALAERLAKMRAEGVPNYFGAQRFGGDNLERAGAMLAGTVTVRDRHLRGLYLSAARSLLFNQVLARRVADGTWQRVLPGDAMQLDGCGSFFIVDTPDDALRHRSERLEIHPTGPLWGRGVSPAAGAARALECEVLRDYAAWCSGLERAGCDQQRRALRVGLTEMEWQLIGGVMELRFRLPAGSYATMVVREAIVVSASVTNDRRPTPRGPVTAAVAV